MQVKISIVSPSYNQGEYIEEAILSVLNQGYADFEHIIIDGGSTDNTVEILKKYPHLIWVSEKDKGQSDAINKGFNRASGDIIGWLNTDDFYLPGTFDTIAKTFADSKADVVYGNIQFVDKEGKFTRILKSHTPNKWLSLFHCYIPSAAFFCKREILDSGIRIDPDFHISMDKEFFAHIFHDGYKFKFLPQTLTSFRWHENNKSINTQEVKEIRYKEGLIIFNRYSKYNFKLSQFNIKMYKNVALMLIVLKKVFV